MNPVHVPPTSTRLYQGKAPVTYSTLSPEEPARPLDAISWIAIGVIVACFVASAWGA